MINEKVSRIMETKKKKEQKGHLQLEGEKNNEYFETFFSQFYR